MIAFESRIEGQKDACFIFQCREVNFGRITLDFRKTDGSVEIVDRHAVNFVGAVTIPPGPTLSKQAEVAEMTTVQSFEHAVRPIWIIAQNQLTDGLRVVALQNSLVGQDEGKPEIQQFVVEFICNALAFGAVLPNRFQRLDQSVLVLKLIQMRRYVN